MHLVRFVLTRQWCPGGNGPNVVPGHRGPVRNVNEEPVEAVDSVVPEVGDRRAVHRSGLAFSTRMLVLQLAVVALVIILTAGVYGWLTYQRLSDEIGSKSLAVAQSLAVEEPIRKELGAVATADLIPGNSTLRTGPVQQLAEVLRDRTDALFVVVTDRSGLRWSHPNPAELGRPVSTSPDAALSGQEITVQETGTLGPSVRSKVPVWSADGRSIVGEVSVGFSTRDVLAGLQAAILPILGVAAVALTLGTAGTALLSRRLRTDTLGLEPAEIGELVQDQAVVLYGVDEGVLGIAEDGRVTICNGKARRLLGLAGTSGRTLAELGLPSRVLALLEPANADGNKSVQMMVNGSVLIMTARKVVRGRRKLGWVLMVRDRTDVEALSRQLDAVGALSTALRAQRHEFANRLHAVSGLLNVGRADEAASYLQATLKSGPLKYPVDFAGKLEDTYLQAFIGAKALRAAELGVPLRLGDATLITGTVSDPQNVTTVLGNLVDNAVAAAVRGACLDRWVEVELLSEDTTLHLTVADSGDGLQGVDPEAPFKEGYSTAGRMPGQDPERNPDQGPADWLEAGNAGQGEGLGLTLSRQIARSRGGDVWVISPGEPGGPGAVFCARLPRVLALNDERTRIEG
ncbi:sensor histidine kinase [Arthrobacter humicola]|uniref:histidine kinase n=1 Tax=Arthrobacter humicola TaxID=409291 RepID=A0ABN2YWH5_9MICC